MLSLGIEPMILALLAPCSTIWATGKHTHTHTHTQTHTHTHTQTHTQTHTHRQTDRHTHTQTHTQTHRQTDRQARTHAHRHTHTQTHTQTDRHTHTQTDRHTDRQTDRHVRTHTHTDRQTGTHAHKHTHTHTLVSGSGLVGRLKASWSCDCVTGRASVVLAHTRVHLLTHEIKWFLILHDHIYIIYRYIFTSDRHTSDDEKQTGVSQQTDQTLALLDLLLHFIAGRGDLGLRGEHGADEGEDGAAQSRVEGPAHGAQAQLIGRGVWTAVTLHFIWTPSGGIQDQPQDQEQTCRHTDAQVNTRLETQIIITIILLNIVIMSGPYDQNLIYLKIVIYMCLWSTKAVISNTGILYIHCMGQNNQFFFYAKNH